MRKTRTMTASAVKSAPAPEIKSIPPVNRSDRLLPLHKIHEVDFEHICAALIKFEPGIFRVDLKNARGKSQYGVDVEGFSSAQNPSIVLSAKRYQRITPAVLRLWSDEFINHWNSYWEGRHVDRFILAVTVELNEDSLSLQIKREFARFQKINVSYEIWGLAQLTERIKSYPKLVSKYFHHAWLDTLNVADEGMSSVGSPLRIGIRSNRLIYRIPSLPERYQERTNDIASLKSVLIGRSQKVVGIVGSRATGLVGMGGIGKTVIATALANDADVQQTFPAGLVWLTFGRDATVLNKQDELIFAISGVQRGSRDIYEGNGALNILCQKLEQPLLVILDDVWDIESTSAAFANLDPRLRLLVTTRDRRVLDELGALSHEVGLLDRDAALDFLAAAVGIERQKLPAESGEVIARCGRLPLALASVGALLRHGTYNWTEVLEALREARQHEFPSRWLGDPDKANLAAVLKISIDALSSTALDCLTDFAILREDAPVSEEALVRIWQTLVPAKRHARAIATELVDRSILGRSHDGIYTIHDLYRDFLRDRLASIEARHEQLVHRYKLHCPDDWYSGPDDGYYFQNLSWHLRQSGLKGILKDILLSSGWMKKKIETTGIAQLLQDYTNSESETEIDLIAASLRLSTTRILESAAQLPTQICGRLSTGDGSAIENLLVKFRAELATEFIIPIANGFLDRPGQLVRIYSGHASFVNTITVTHDGRRFATGSEDGTIILWNFETGAVVRRFARHETGVNAVVLAEHSGRLLSGSDGGEFKVWDIATGALLATLQCRGPVNRIVGLEDGWRAVISSAKDGILLFDIPAMKFLRNFPDVKSEITALASIGGGRVLSGHFDGSMYMWDVVEGEIIQRYTNHTDLVRAMTIWPDPSTIFAVAGDGTAGKWSISGDEIRASHISVPVASNAIVLLPRQGIGLSGAFDGTLRVWALTDGTKRIEIQAHGDAVSSVAAMPGQNFALTGSYDSQVRLWDIWAQSVNKPCFACGSDITSITVSEDVRYLLSGSEDGVIRLWDLATGIASKEIKAHDGTVKSVFFSREQIAISAATDGNIALWNYSSDTLINKFDTKHGVINCLTLIGEDQIAIGSGDGTFSIWTVDGSCLFEGKDRHSASISTIARLQSERTVATASFDGEIRIWDIDDETVVNKCCVVPGDVNNIKYDNENARLFIASVKGNVVVFDTIHGRVVQEFEPFNMTHNDTRDDDFIRPAAISIAYLSEHQLLAVSYSTNWLHFIDLQSGKVRLIFKDDYNISSSISDRRGSKLFTGNQGGRIHIFDVAARL